MKIIEVAREQRDILNEGIAYIAVWQELQKNGKKSWFTEDFYAEEVNDCEPIFGEEELARFGEIAELDEQAILLNGYYDSWVGSADEPLTAAQIAEGIKRHYELDSKRLKDFLNAEIGSRNAEDDMADTSELRTPNSELERVTIQLPSMNVKSDILTALIDSKHTIITAALGADGIGELPIEFIGEGLDGRVSFDWLKSEADSDVIHAWSAFLAAACKFSKTAQRVTAKDSGELGDNPKFDFRVFLVKIGLKGSEHKDVRKILLRNLAGSTAFKNAESEAKWKAKYGSKRVESGDDNA